MRSACILCRPALKVHRSDSEHPTSDRELTERSLRTQANASGVVQFKKPNLAFTRHKVEAGVLSWFHLRVCTKTSRRGRVLKWPLRSSAPDRLRERSDRALDFYSFASRWLPFAVLGARDDTRKSHESCSAERESVPNSWCTLRRADLFCERAQCGVAAMESVCRFASTEAARSRCCSFALVALCAPVQTQSLPLMPAWSIFSNVPNKSTFPYKAAIDTGANRFPKTVRLAVDQLQLSVVLHNIAPLFGVDKQMCQKGKQIVLIKCDTSSDFSLSSWIASSCSEE